MRAREIMTAQPEVVTPDDAVSKAAEIMDALDVGIVPVVTDRETMRVIGVITDRDITIRHTAKRHLRDCRVSDHMTRDRLEVVRPDDDVHDVIGRMRHDQVRRMLVVENGHRLVGIISQADIALLVGPHEPVALEEMLVGISQPAHGVH